MKIERRDADSTECNMNTVYEMTRPQDRDWGKPLPHVRTSAARAEIWFCWIKSQPYLYVYIPKSEAPTLEEAKDRANTFLMLVEAGGMELKR